MVSGRVTKDSYRYQLYCKGISHKFRYILIVINLLSISNLWFHDKIYGQFAGIYVRKKESNHLNLLFNHL